MSYRRTLVISPSLLYKDDLFAFEAFLHECEGNKSCDFQVSGIDKGKNISTNPCKSLEELFSANDLPDHLDKLVFEVNETGDEGRIIRNVHVNLDKRVSDIQLTSEDENNQWAKEVGPKLKSFFKQRRPWYWFIGLSIPPVFNISMGLSLIMAAFIFVSKVSEAIVFPATLILSGAIFMGLGVKRVLFRHARICLFQREYDVRPNYELLVIVIHLTVFTVALFGTIIMTAGKI